MPYKFNLKALAKNIDIAIKTSGMSRAEVAEMIGVHPNTINNLLCPSRFGKIMPNIETVLGIARATNTPYDVLFFLVYDDEEVMIG